MSQNPIAIHPEYVPTEDPLSSDSFSLEPTSRRSPQSKTTQSIVSPTSRRSESPLPRPFSQRPYRARVSESVSRTFSRSADKSRRSHSCQAPRSAAKPTLPYCSRSTPYGPFKPSAWENFNVLSAGDKTPSTAVPELSRTPYGPLRPSTQEAFDWSSAGAPPSEQSTPTTTTSAIPESSRPRSSQNAADINIDIIDLEGSSDEDEEEEKEIQQTPLHHFLPHVGVAGQGEAISHLSATENDSSPSDPIPRSRPVVSSTFSRKRVPPTGLLVGTWRLSGLPPHRSHAVYASKDALGRINRRVSKETRYGEVVPPGPTRRATSCLHENVLYLPEFEGLTEAEFKERISVILPTRRQRA